MKKKLLSILLLILFSCTKEKKESYKVNNYEYITKTDSVITKVFNKDTLKFYYLKDQLRTITINDFVTPKYDTVEDDPFYFRTIYCIDQSYEFNGVITELNNIKSLGDFKQNAEYSLSNNVWTKRGSIENYFYDSELLNLDIALTKINNYNYPKSVVNIPNEKLLNLVIDQDKEIALYDVKSLKRIKNQFYKKRAFKYLRDIKVIKKGNEKLVLAKIIETENDVEYYINLKDIVGDVVSAD
ncbi:hypothetical protein [Flavobacterium sp. UBA7680]|uniref:hypothetical protein n=1 Tax=Flavobacterium sp. UBA7680 TaxID=1946559 RepID=UPI0025B8C9BB|nr:hypothetical protein [Flavobacterium sp. UBA7680]